MSILITNNTRTANTLQCWFNLLCRADYLHRSLVIDIFVYPQIILRSSLVSSNYSFWSFLLSFILYSSAFWYLSIGLKIHYLIWGEHSLFAKLNWRDLIKQSYFPWLTSHQCLLNTRDVVSSEQVHSTNTRMLYVVVLMVLAWLPGYSTVSQGSLIPKIHKYRS